jgi:hypothetical protein
MTRCWPSMERMASENARIRTCRRALLGLAAGLLAALANCAPRADYSAWNMSQMQETVRRQAKPAAVENQHVVFIALDGVRWQEVFSGVDADFARKHGLPRERLVPAQRLMPELHGLIATTGVALGAPEYGGEISASGPNFMSVPGYMEMLSGRRPVPCADNGCMVSQPTLLDELATVPGVEREDVAVIASWEGLERAAALDPNRITISAGRTHGATRHLLNYDDESARLLQAGTRAGPDPGQGDFRRDRETAAIALRYLDTHEPAFLFLGLGEPDEYGHRNDYGRYLAALEYCDRVIGEVVKRLRALEARGRSTTLVVTTDHGRSETFAGHGEGNPESARVWLVAAGTRIAARGYTEAPAARYLADLAPTVRSLVGLPGDPSKNAGHVLTELLQPNRESAVRAARARLIPASIARAAE